MNEKLNLVEILKDAPKGTKLWSPVCGECELFDVNITRKSFPIVCIGIGIGGGTKWLFKANGTFVKNTGVECVLFPSKDNRDWSTFKVPNIHKHFEPFQKVLWVDHIQTKAWTAGFYSHYNELINRHVLVSGYIKRDYDILPYEGNEDKLGKKVENEDNN